jgi:hypothetical protein
MWTSGFEAGSRQSSPSECLILSPAGNFDQQMIGESIFLPQVYSQGMNMEIQRQIFLPAAWQDGYNSRFGESALKKCYCFPAVCAGPDGHVPGQAVRQARLLPNSVNPGARCASHPDFDPGLKGVLNSEA